MVRRNAYKKCTPAQKQLVESNIKLVSYVIKKYFYYYCSNSYSDVYDDLFQEGCLFLIKAAKYTGKTWVLSFLHLQFHISWVE